MAVLAPTESFIPSPTVSAFHLGPLAIHSYALCILAGIALALWLGSQRWQQRGGGPGQVLDICIWAIPARIIGDRWCWATFNPRSSTNPSRCVIAGFAILFVDSRIRLGAGSVFALYVAGYSAGRFAFELMRSDFANLILGLRVNTWVAALVFLAGAVAFIARCRHPRSTVQPKEEPRTRAPGREPCCLADSWQGRQPGRGPHRPCWVVLSPLRSNPRQSRPCRLRRPHRGSGRSGADRFLV